MPAITINRKPNNDDNNNDNNNDNDNINDNDNENINNNNYYYDINNCNAHNDTRGLR